MAIIICGHQRPGTTMLQSICTQHPQMAGTREFGCFSEMVVTTTDMYATSSID